MLALKKNFCNQILLHPATKLLFLCGNICYYTSMIKDFYSTSQVAQILKISRIEVFRRIKTEKLKAEKVGRNYIIPRSAVVEALGKEIGTQKKEEINQAIKRAIRDYGETFKRLGKT